MANKVNQLIQFEDGRVLLTPGFSFAVHNYLTPTGAKRFQKLKFQDFPIAIHKLQTGPYHLFELKRNKDTFFAYCIIKKQIK